MPALMIVVTGGAGFIGSALVSFLNQKGESNLIVVDELGSSERWKNLYGKAIREYFHKDEFLELARRDALPGKVSAIFHLGACSSTTEPDADYLMRNNYRYSIEMARLAERHGARFIYASSAATYGDGQGGYSDEAPLVTLRPLNGYGFSKHLFDVYMESHGLLARAAGLKFFNVFGPNEYHKADMRSVVLKSWEQIVRGEPVKLFRSYRADYADGEQKRDFVYVKDCCRVMLWLLENPGVNGLFNLGSGKARSWNELVRAVYSALGKKPSIEYIDMPPNLQGQYQYYTCAPMEKLSRTGCPVKFESLEESISDYVVNYLERRKAIL